MLLFVVICRLYNLFSFLQPNFSITTAGVAARLQVCVVHTCSTATPRYAFAVRVLHYPALVLVPFKSQCCLLWCGVLCGALR